MKIKSKHYFMLLIIFIGFILFQLINYISNSSFIKSTQLEKNGLIVTGQLRRLQGNTNDLLITQDLKSSYENWLQNKNELTELMQAFLKSDFFIQNQRNKDFDELYQKSTIGWNQSLVKLDEIEQTFEKYFSNSDADGKGILIQVYGKQGAEVFPIYSTINNGKTALHEVFSKNYMLLVDGISEISNRQIKRNQFISILITFCILSGIFIFMFFIIRSINIEINKIEIGISKMKNKELADRIEISSNSEIAKLGKDVNDFTDSLGLSFFEIKKQSENNLQIKESLIASVIETSSAVEQMKSSIQSIYKQVSVLDNNIIDSSVSTSDNMSKITTLSEKIDRQLSGIKDSENFLKRIMEIISSVSEISNTNMNQLEILISTSKSGGEKLDKTTTIFNDVYNSINEINKMVGIIQGIASQTSILSMNAAIEAAHAGEKGKGFSVVADEIRKLAEASNKNSKEISQNLKEITNSITTANTSGIETQKAFKEIDQNVVIISNSFQDIFSSTHNLNDESIKIMDVMKILIGESNDIKQFSESVRRNSNSIKNELDSITKISESVNGGISEVSVGLDEVVQAMIQIGDISQNIDKMSGKLDELVNEFKIEPMALVD